MRGEKVIVRDYKGKPLLRRVWEVGSNTIYITDDEGFAKLIDGNTEVWPIGFPVSDVFRYDPGSALSVENYDWSKATLWQ